MRQNMAKTLSPKTFLFTSLVAAAVVVACGGGGGGGSASAPPVIFSGTCTQSLKTGYSGNFEASASDNGSTGGGNGAAAGGGLGKVLGGQMTVSDLSNGSVIGTATTDATSGLVTVKTCGLTGPFLLTLEGKAGAKYYDEGLNQLVDFGAGKTLHALVDAWDEHVGVSPLTEAAYRYALNNFKADPASIAAGTSPLVESGSATGLTTAQVVQANNLVKTQINSRYTTNYQMASAKSLPTPLDVGSGATTLQDNRYGRSAAVNGGLVKAASYYNPSFTAPALTFVNDLARDLTDGKIDGFALDGTPVAASDAAAYENVRLPIGGMVGTNAITRRFGLAPAKRVVDEISVGFADPRPDNNDRDCNGWSESAALLSDGSVTLYRHFPTVLASGKCTYKLDANENLRDQKIYNYITDVKQLGTGDVAARFAIKNDGTVVGWGQNICGVMSPSLAPGFYQQPVVIPGLRDITSITGSAYSVIARDKTGAMFVWGNIANLGGTSSAPSGYSVCKTDIPPGGTIPYNLYMANAIQKIPTISNIDQVYAVNGNYFAKTISGDVYAWGGGFAGLLANSNGILQSGGFLSGATIANPTLIPNLGKVKSLTESSSVMYALMLDGTIKAWGSDFMYLLGNGVQKPITRPTTIAGLDNIRTLAGNTTDGIRLLKYDGTVLTWGFRNYDYNNRSNNPPSFYVPRVIATPLGQVRHMVGAGSNLYVFFENGDIAYDVDTPFGSNAFFVPN
jgi:hypothetical protein